MRLVTLGVGAQNSPRYAPAARRLGVKWLIFAHIGRPTLRALDRGFRPAFGGFAVDGQVFACSRQRASRTVAPGNAVANLAARKSLER